MGSLLDLDASPNALGHGRILPLGELEVQIGIERSQWPHGTDYHREPRGYITLRTSARGKVRAERDFRASSMRDLGQTLIKYADLLDAWQTADDDAD